MILQPGIVGFRLYLYKNIFNRVYAAEDIQTRYSILFFIVLIDIAKIIFVAGINKVDASTRSQVAVKPVAYLWRHIYEGGIVTKGQTKITAKKQLAFIKTSTFSSFLLPILGHSNNTAKRKQTGSQQIFLHSHKFNVQ